MRHRRIKDRQCGKDLALGNPVLAKTIQLCPSPGLCGKGEVKRDKNINRIILDSPKRVKNSQQNQEELILLTSPGRGV